MKQDKTNVVDELIGQIEVKGVKYNLYQGSKGGKYYYKNGKKTYYREPKPKAEKPKVVEVNRFIGKAAERMKTFYCTIYDLDEDGESLGDGSNEWHNAFSEEEAYDYWESEYPNRRRYDTLNIYDWKYANE